MPGSPLPETCCATIWIWLGQAVYFGPSLRLDAHSGSVHCLAVGVDAPFTVATGGLGARQARSALIPARTRHRIVAGGGRMLFCYLDPAVVLTEQMTEQHGPIGLGHRREAALLAHLRGTPDPARLRDLLGPPRTEAVDERIRTALDILRAHPAAGLSADRLAAEVHLSTSRFLHLFPRHAHTSFRRYRLWARMLQVATAVSKGRDLTRAATEAGFASPGHFSDSFHAMFGLTASALLSGQTRLVVLDPV